MKKLDKIILVLFSVIILIEGIVATLLIAGWVDLLTVVSLMKRAVTTSPADQVILGLSIVGIILSVKCIFFDGSYKNGNKKDRDVLMQNDNGRLIISITTLENIVTSVVKSFDSAIDSNTRIQLDNENNVIVLVNLTVTKDVVIKELTLNMQNKIKESIKRTSDLEVKEVNVRIKNIAIPEEKTENQ